MVIQGVLKVCSDGLAVASPRNFHMPSSPFPWYRYTYAQAHEACKNSGMVLRNSHLPWTKTCDIAPQLKADVGADTYDLNDQRLPGQLYGKAAVLCQILNYGTSICVSVTALPV